MTETVIQIDEYDQDPTTFYTEVEVEAEYEVVETGEKYTQKVTVLVPFIRQSERKAFKTCQYQWDWAWNQGFTPALTKTDARWFGTGLHLALAEWYITGKKRGRNMHETWEEFCGDNYAKISIGPYFDATEWVDAKALGHEMIDNYLAEYGDDSEWEVIATEQRYRMKIRDQNTGVVVGILVGTFDAVLRHIPTNKVWMIDHKTARDKIMTNHLVKDEQAGTYVSIATIVLRAQGKIGPDEVVQGIVYNFLRKAKADTRPRNKRGAYTNKPTKDNFVDAIYNYVTNLINNPQVKGTELAREVEGYADKAVLKKFKGDELAALASGFKLEVFGEESKQQPPPLFKREFVVRNAHERARQIERIREELQQMHALRSGGLALTKAPGDHCGWCDFKDLCDVDEQGGDAADYARAAFRRRDPYADHRIGAENSKSSVAADSKAKAKVRKF